MAQLSCGESFAVNLCNLIFAVVLLPIWLIQTINIVGQREIMIFEAFGKIIETRDKPGCNFYAKVACVEKRTVMTKIQTMSIKGSSVPDKNGSPMHVSVIVNFRINDAIAYLYSVENPNMYIQNQALEVIRSIASRFAFRSEKEPSIMADGKMIGLVMKELLQHRCDVVGVTILAMEITDVAFSAEMAQSLLLT